MQLEAGAFYVHRARALADLAGLGPSSLSRPCRRAHATDARLCRFHSDVPACSSHICIMVCLTDLMRLLLSPRSRNDRAQLQSLLHCIAALRCAFAFELRSHFALCSSFALRSRFALCSRFALRSHFALCSRFCLAQLLSPCAAALHCAATLHCAAAFALSSRFCPVQPLSPCTAAFALHSRFCLM